MLTFSNSGIGYNEISGNNNIVGRIFTTSTACIIPAGEIGTGSASAINGFWLTGFGCKFCRVISRQLFFIAYAMLLVGLGLPGFSILHKRIVP